MRKLLAIGFAAALSVAAAFTIVRAADFGYQYPLLNEPFIEQWMKFYFDGITIGTQSPSRVVTADANSNVIGLGQLQTMFPLPAGTNVTLTQAQNDQYVQLNNATGGKVVLPPATGTGTEYWFYVSVLATSGSYVITAQGSDNYVGIINGTRVDSGNAVLGFAAQSTSNTITLNRTTTGSVSLGEWVHVVDVASHVWQVTGTLSATGAAFATPFSHV